MNVAIIYHRADYDGKLSGAICRAKLLQHDPAALIHSFGWDYNDPLPAGINFETYDKIFIVDLSVDELMARPALEKKIVWIDHHRTAIAKWGGKFEGLQVDGVAACRLCWAYFGAEGWFPVNVESYRVRRDGEPLLVYLAGVYDVWLKDNPNFESAKDLQFGLRALESAALEALIHDSISGVPGQNLVVEGIVAKGRELRKFCQKQNDDYSAECAQTIRWFGLTWCALNIGQRGNSDLLLGGIKPEHDACFAWRWDGKAVSVSLYHIVGKEQFDLSAFAKRFGGGGHKGACGFRLSLEDLSNILTFDETCVG